MSSRPSSRGCAVLPLRPDGSLRIVAVADTHGSPHRELKRQVAGLRPDAILHAGDVGDLTVLHELSALAPVFAVRGNIDEASPELVDTLALDLIAADRAVLRILLVHIGFRGVQLRPEIVRMARDLSASLVVCGHSHIPFVGRDRGIDVFNPGSAGPRRFSLPIVFGVLDWSGKSMRFAHLECESGNPWHPPTVPARSSQRA